MVLLAHRFQFPIKAVILYIRSRLEIYIRFSSVFEILADVYGRRRLYAPKLVVITAAKACQDTIIRLTMAVRYAETKRIAYLC